MTRAKVAPTHTHKAQHPRMFSSSSSSSISSSSSSSCSLSPGPPQGTSTTTTTTITARKRSSWMLSHHEKPGWEDTTTAAPFEGPQQHQSHKDHKDHGSPTHQHTHKQRHQTSGSCDQVVPTTNPHSPPSSPLPLGLQKHNGTTDADTTTLAREVTDMDSEDDQGRRYKQHPTGRVVQGRSSAASDYGSGHHSARSAMQITAESATAARSRRKETGGSTRTTTTTTPEISNRPRFSFSTVVNPRAQVHSAGTATREAAVTVPKDVSTKTTTARSSRTVKESVATPRATKSTTSSLGGHVQPTTKSVSTTRISKSRSPTTITTTTTTTTRRVASTIITMGPHHDREHRKLATANVSAAAANALSTKTSSSSSRKERTTRASNLAPATAGVGRATTSRGGGRQTGVEPTVERTNAITIPTTAEHNDNKNATTQYLSIAKPTTTTTTLLPALQMEGEEDFVQDITSTPTGVAINSPSSKPSSPSTLPPVASAEIPHILSSPISSPIIVASRPKTPPPPYQTAILHNTSSSDMVHQTPDMPSITACSPTKETAPIIQEQHEHTEVYLAMPPAAVLLSKTEASPVAGSKQSPGIAKSMTVTTAVSAPSTFLLGTPRIFRAMREASSPRVLGVQQQQPILTSQSEIKARRDQERPAEVPTTPVPTTMHRTKSEDLAAEEPTETRSTLLTTSTPVTIPDLVGAEEAPKPQPQPFRKNIWNGRMDKFTKTWSTPLSHEESIPTAQGNAPARTGILAAMGASVSRAPLTKVKDPAVMRDLMVLAKERRASRTLCDGVAENGASGFRSASTGGNQFRDRSRMQFEHANDNDNDTPITTNLMTNHNNTCNSLSTSAPSGKITFEDKKAFLKTQEMRRRNNLRRSRSLNTVDPPYYPFPSSPSPAPAQDSLSIDTRPGFPWKGRATTVTPPIPAMSVTIPLKVATVLQGMGYPINNTNNTSATSPLCSSPSPSPSPTWSTPSTPRIIPSSHSSSSISSFSSASTASSSVSSMSSMSSMSSASSANSKTLPLSFPDRLFQARSPSAGGAPVAMMPRSFSPRPVRATSITGTSGPSSYYSTQTHNNHQTPLQSSTMLPSLPSPALSLAVQERQRVSNRSVEGYSKPRLFSGSRSEDEQQVRQNTLRPFERAIVQQQQQQQQQRNKLTSPQRAAAAGVHALWSSSSIKSNSMPQLLPPPLSPSPSSPSSLSITDQEDSATDSDRERRVYERSASTTSIDRAFFTEQVFSNQFSQEDHHSCVTTTQPVTQDISFLTKRLANLQLMDSLCPVSTPTPTQSLLPQQQQQQQGGMDATWAMQIQLLLTHLAEQTDLEQESRLRPLPPPPRPHTLLLPEEEEPEAGQKKKVGGMGMYKQVLTDWLLRLDQLSTITSPSTGSSLYKEHPGLKREVEKIRWQHNVPSKPNNRSK